MPKTLPAEPHVVWEVKLDGLGLGGIAATREYVVFGDRDGDDFFDVFRCLDAGTGQSVWTFRYPAIGALDYGNSPRATPLIDGQRVFLFGAFGELHCLSLADGQVLWHLNVRQEFKVKAEMPWGYCGSPLLVDGMLIVNPGADEASLVALNPEDGKVIWTAAGKAASYGSLIVGSFGGVRQIVGHDVDSLGGWDVKTGRRLWRLEPQIAGDFNVPTPLAIDDKLLVCTENNGTRLYGFTADGRINPQPVMENHRLAPDMSSPVRVGGRVFCVRRLLYCLNLAEDLRIDWRQRDAALADYGSIFADDERLLVVGKGELLLVDALSPDFRLLSRQQVCTDRVEIFPHPALVGDKLYLRGERSLKCLSLR